MTSPMTRITVDEVLDAYKKCGALPIRGAHRAPGFELCPLAALAYARDVWAPSCDDVEKKPLPQALPPVNDDEIPF